MDTVAGEFTVDLVGPGIYQATIAADGFAIARSEPVNTDTMGAEPITVKLTRGVEIRGTIVDEQGQPIDGATVAPLSASTSALAASAGPRPRTAIPFTGSEGAVKSSKGAFQLALVPAGTEMLRVTHPEYCFAFSSEIAVGKENIDLKPIVLTRGGTVRGTVYDADGKPEPNVSIIFHDRSGYGGTDDELAGRLATAVTDKNGAVRSAALAVAALQRSSRRGVERERRRPHGGAAGQRRSADARFWWPARCDGPVARQRPTCRQHAQSSLAE